MEILTGGQSVSSAAKNSSRGFRCLWRIGILQTGDGFVKSVNHLKLEFSDLGSENSGGLRREVMPTFRRTMERTIKFTVENMLRTACRLRVQ